MSTHRPLLALLFVLATTLEPLAAQELSPELRARLEKMKAKPPATWTQADFDEFGRVIVAASAEIVRGGMTAAQRARTANTQVRVVEDASGRHAWADRNAIFVSGDALGSLIALGFTIGHDSWVLDGGELPLPPTLLLTPYRSSLILPLLPVLHETAGTTPFHLLRCPPNEPECEHPQEAAVVAGTIGFVIAHEMAHVILGHAAQKNQPLADELAADRLAWSILERIAPAAKDAEADELLARFRAAILAGPFVVLRWLRDDPQEASDSDLDERAETLRDLAGAEYFGDISTLAEPESPPSSRLRSIRVSWTEEPAELYVDGVRVSPRELAGKPLTLLVPAKIFAIRDGRFAFAEITTETGAVALTFAAPLPGVLPDGERKRLRKERQWFALFLRTTTSSMTPATPAAAGDFRRALAELGMGRRPLSQWR